jgi:hypothetical protein
MKNAILASLLLPITLFAGNAIGQDNLRHVLPGSNIDEVKTLAQNWTDAESNEFYNIPQGSRLVPYDLFKHLERADSEDSFRSEEHIRELGYIPRKVSDDNPDGLPIGFIKDAPYNAEIAGLGITCAACHTGLIVHDKTAYIVDGAPTLGDFEMFLNRLTKSIRKTADDDPKFERFAAKVLPDGSSNHLKRQLRGFIRSIADERELYNSRNLSADDAHRFGPGRVDAFGAIFNQVSAQYLNIPENAKPANAPVSYPCLWDAPQHDRVQWNGAAENRKSALGEPLFGTDQVGALGRNAGEVLGVFGRVDINQFELLLPRRYESSVKKENLIAIEKSLEKLWSPKWPFPPIENEAEIRKRGEIVYKNSCIDCHAIIKRDDENRKVKAYLGNVGTDLMMLKNFGRTGKTGRLEGRRKTILSSERFQAEEPVGVILKHVVERTILNSLSLADLKKAIKTVKIADFDSLNPGYMNTAIIKVGEKEYRVPLDELIKKAESVELVSSASKLLAFAEGLRGDETAPKLEGLGAVPKNLLEVKSSSENAPATAVVEGASASFGYKARPLNGVWATAPYLHNGSVPNLTELLKSHDERKKTVFRIGSTEYDIANVGFVIDDENFPIFDTTVEGNHNTGHEFGSELTPQQKLDLIEYLKSL